MFVHLYFVTGFPEFLKNSRFTKVERTLKRKEKTRENVKKFNPLKNSPFKFLKFTPIVQW